MICEIKWNILSLKEWEARFNSVARSNILQSYDYAKAAAATHRQKARWGLIVIDGVEAGLVQLMEASILWRLCHAVILDRGPLWFDGFGNAVHVKLFFEQLNKQLPARLGRKRRILPEIDYGQAAHQIMLQAGFKKGADDIPYQTLWWDLETQNQEARKNLRPNWRGSLQKAENSLENEEITVEWDTQGKFYSWLKCECAVDKAMRGYRGISPQLLDNLASFSTNQPFMVIGKVSHKGEDIAGVLFLLHGQSATYQIGCSSDLGRKYCAHHLLLWRARDVLKEYNIKQIDLGGINDDAAEGIKKFKTGTGASFVQLLGHYA